MRYACECAISAHARYDAPSIICAICASAYDMRAKRVSADEEERAAMLMFEAPAAFAFAIFTPFRFSPTIFRRDAER